MTDTLDAKWPPLVEMSRTISFFTSVIKSGESWSPECQAAYDRANIAVRALFRSEIDLATANAEIAGLRKLLSEKRNAHEMAGMPITVIMQHFREFAEELAAIVPVKGEPVAWRWKQKTRTDADAWTYQVGHPQLPTTEYDIERVYASPVPEASYVPTIIHFEDADRSEFVATDEAHVYAENVTVQAVRSMHTRELRGFAWYGKEPPVPEAGTWPEPYDTWTADQIGEEVERLKIVRDTTNRMIEDMIDKCCAMLAAAPGTEGER